MVVSATGVDEVAAGEKPVGNIFEALFLFFAVIEDNIVSGV